MKGKKPKYVIKLPLQKAPVVESPIVQPNPSEAENVVPIPSQPSVVEPTHSQPSIVQPMPSQPPLFNLCNLILIGLCRRNLYLHLWVPNVFLLDAHHYLAPLNRMLHQSQCPPEIIENVLRGRPTNVNRNRFYPSRVASKAITKTIKQQFVQPWSSWGEIPDEQKTVFFERFKEEFQTLFSQAKSEAASCGGGEETSPLDQVEEEKLKNKSWLVAAGGKNPKGRVYGVGKLNEGYLSRETFTQQTSSSAADSQKIIRLEEDIRQSREENQRLQRKLESLVNVVLPILPPAAQIILQDMNEQPQNDHQNQNHAQEGEQHDGHSSSPHYADY
ncbi:hypothetical protein Fmac_026030 [Flemingia macrophylla]|uniref:Transposase n=1 Tax=Flemingia macrophylla TaxID=520843 RepID=A0ABD1LDV9_9FABA